ncbi:hypothetical protein HJFPF1_06061 [Paramyrothecium foliicola]|nr:hypothetical protein HJFPF1_06061 [Paramyrothecium foliicola]
MIFTNFLALVISAVPLALAQSCGQDNCYRAIRNYQDKTSAGFCGSYLASQTAAPSPFATCGPVRLSSACNCLVTATATATATATTAATTLTTSTTSSTSTSASPTPSNLIINGSFESSANRNDLSPWTAGETGGASIANNRESTSFFPFRARTGTQFSMLGHQGQEEPPVILSQSVNLTAGQSYTFTAYYSVLDLKFDQCYLKGIIGSTTVAEVAIFANFGGGNPPPWFRLSGAYVASATEPTSVSVSFHCDDSTWGVFGLDDVSLV